MKWNRNWLVKQKNGKFDFEETITFPKEMFYNLSRINDLKDVEVTGSGNFNSSEDSLSSLETIRNQMHLYILQKIHVFHTSTN